MTMQRISIERFKDGDAEVSAPGMTKEQVIELFITAAAMLGLVVSHKRMHPVMAEALRALRDGEEVVVLEAAKRYGVRRESMSVALQRLVDEGKAVRVRRGVYRKAAKA